MIGSPGKGSDVSRVFGRDRGWNVSIRRRKRHEGVEDVGLAEQGDDTPDEFRPPQDVQIPTQPPLQSEADASGTGYEAGPGTSLPSRASSMRSEQTIERRSQPPRTLTGEVSAPQPIDESRLTCMIAIAYRGLVLPQRPRPRGCARL